MSEVAEKTLLGYVPELLDELERIRAEEDAARAELGRIDAKITETEAALEGRRAELVKPNRSRVLAEAALTGGAAPPEPKDPPGADPKDLEATIQGLRLIRQEPTGRVQKAKAALRANTIQAFREGAERAAVDLIAAAERVGRLHAEIGAAQRLVESLGGPPGDVVVGLDWFDLKIPSSEQIKALAPATRLAYFKPMLVGGDAPSVHEAASEAFEVAKAEVRRRLGGRWPLEREF